MYKDGEEVFFIVLSENCHIKIMKVSKRLLKL